MTSTAIALTIDHLQKSFLSGAQKLDVLKDVSLHLAGGESLAIVGPSGSGKSTLLHIIGTLEPPDSGQVTINGKDPFSLSEPELARFRNTAIGFVFQDHHLLPQYSVLENVLMPTLAFPADRTGAQERAEKLIRQVGLSDRMGHLPGMLSGGERQRVAIARALINRPSLLLCDEPTGNLDHATADKISALLFQLHQSENNIMIVVTHNLALAGQFPRNVSIAEGVCSEI